MVGIQELQQTFRFAQSFQNIRYFIRSLMAGNLEFNHTFWEHPTREWLRAGGWSRGS